ncbi:helicase-related protein (plasmid) [Rhizobium sullae]|uniref:Helicase-related protein n=1 Tax=Rhizobium sullae TaxID=50338 RepID=A0ABY5XY13_RHISU|nr:helicase-related protein [Rhizobium sullae]UWU19532.1 helicase-related protein [Rhizobium sullae]
MTYQADEHLKLLKPFQRATVDYVFRRLFTDPRTTRQFLVADEVGLGKTMVARGVIAKAIEELTGKVDRIDVVYICSNQAIAEQNIKSLNVIGSAAKPLNTRLTLLPLEIEQDGGIASRPINLISLTPGTALDLKSSLGTAKERALIYEMLRKRIGIRHKGIQRVFRGGVDAENWPGWTDWMRGQKISEEIAKNFNVAVGDEFIVRIRAASELARSKKKPVYPPDQRPAVMIGELRRILARICVDALSPDLIILDEFQRFADLLHEHDEQSAPEKAAAAELARALFSYSGTDGSKARLLLLSATPYRMLTLNSDDPEEGDHYGDFLRTMRFLFGEEDGEVRIRELERELKGFRRALQAMPEMRVHARFRRDRVQHILAKVIARTERVDSTDDRNALVKESKPELTIETEDLKEAKAIAHVAAIVGAPGIVEYWKSSPYLLNFMREYKLRQKLQTLKLQPSSELRSAIKAAAPFLISKEQVESYGEIPLRNARMRVVADTAFEHGLDRALWLPPSRPSYGEQVPATKSLIFSDWSMVPDAIAALLSHEASRRMGMTSDLVSRTSRPIGIEEMMPMLCPSPTLAAWVDPLALERRFGRASRYDDLHLQAVEVLTERIDASRLLPLTKRSDRLLPLTLEEELGEGVDWGRVGAIEHEGHDEHGAMARAIEVIGNAVEAEDHPDDSDVKDTYGKLAEFALGSPATCALRALGRLCPELPLNDPALIGAAMVIALGFRSLYNQPESRALLGETSPLNYWRQINAHAARHDLAAVLDEYLQLVIDAEHATELDAEKRAALIANKVVEVVALRPAQITLDHWTAGRSRLHDKTFEVRARFAMRFATKAEDEKGIRRTTLVQAAFKSPFRPFVLASTSIGQEGLDFHPYCSRVVHWNLPRNPVDIEQREGRVHRFKNHAVRRNIAAKLGDSAICTDALVAPWERMFEDARKHEIAQGRPGDIVPYWLFPGDNKIERVVLIPPFSREVERFENLKKSLATYRLAFGQPRQDELINLFSAFGPEVVAELSNLQISLRPLAMGSSRFVGPGSEIGIVVSNADTPDNTLSS